MTHSRSSRSRRTRIVIAALLAAGTVLVANPASAAIARLDPNPPSPGAGVDDEHALTGPPIPASMAPFIASAACERNGETAEDRAIADRLRGQMNGPQLRGGALNSYNVSCARIIAETTMVKGLDKRAALIAITTATTETALHNYTQAVDHDSLGLFQQRAGWGTEQQRTDPVYATGKFLDAMRAHYPNNSWESGDIGAICQTVQVSQFPDRYDQNVHDAQLLVDTVWSQQPPVVTVWPRSGGPAVFDPVNNHVEVYYRSGSSSVDESYWAAGRWLGGTVGGPVTEGRPVAVYNPVSKNLEVYFNSNGHLTEVYYTADGVWHPGVSVGAGIMAGSPAVVYNAGQQSMEIYYNRINDPEASIGTLTETWWQGGNWHTGEVGGLLTGSPSAVFNERNSHVEVYLNAPTADGRHELAERYWSPDHGWQGAGLGSPIADTASPSALYNSANNNVEVYYATPGGNLTETYWTAATGEWSGPHGLGGTISDGDPSAFLDPNNTNVEVYYNSDGKLTETFHSGAQWIGPVRPGGDQASETILGGPFTVYNYVNHNTEVYFNNNHTLAEYYHNGHQWSNLATIGGNLH